MRSAVGAHHSDQYQIDPAVLATFFDAIQRGIQSLP
jgi:hypothetical protein